MSDPKNIPLSEAKIGDIVHLKPQRVGYLPPAKNYLATDQLLLVKPGMIDHIERAPRPLEVGDEVRILDDARKTVIVGISDGWAWLKRSDGQHWTRALEGLERVDG